MDGSNEQAGAEQPLRRVYPEAYRLLMEQFSKCHLHPYDVKADAAAGPDGKGIRIILRYGEGMAQANEKYFTYEELEQRSSALSEFYTGTAEACRKTLVAEYYKMMKP